MKNNLKPLVQKSEVYKSQETFSFLPGHRKLLLSLSQKVEEFQSSKLKKNDQNQQQNTSEQIELLQESEVDALKEKLLAKLNSIVETIGTGNVSTEDNVIGTVDAYISQSHRTNNKPSSRPSYKCALKCAECEKIIPCTWIGYWQVCNFDRHLKKHI